MVKRSFELGSNIFDTSMKERLAADVFAIVCDTFLNGAM